MKTLLVATDFSPAATNAANYAADMALAINATVVLLHVYQMPVIYLEVPVAYTEEEMRRDAQKNINRLKGELQLKRGTKLMLKIWLFNQITCILKYIEVLLLLTIETTL